MSRIWFNYIDGDPVATRSAFEMASAYACAAYSHRMEALDESDQCLAACHMVLVEMHWQSAFETLLGGRVAGKDPEALVEAAIRNLGRLAIPKRPRWAHVAELFAVGSTTAHLLCRWHGLDPDEEIGRDPLEAAGLEMCVECETIDHAESMSDCPHCGAGPLCGGSCLGITEHMCSADGPDDDEGE